MDIKKLLDEIQRDNETYDYVKSFIRRVMNDIEVDRYTESMDKVDDEFAKYYKKLEKRYNKQ